MGKIKLRTKLEIFGALLVIALLVTVSAASLTRTITDSTDNFSTFIRNSNGNYWEATGTNLQSAINDLTSGGTVWLPSGMLTITSRIYLNNNIALIGGGVNVTRIYSNQPGAFIPVTVDGKQNVTISGLTIDMNNVGSNGMYITGGAKNIWITDVSLYHVGYQGIYTSGVQFLYISNVKVKHGDSSATHGFGLDALKDSVIDNCIFEDYETDPATGIGIDVHGENVTMSNIIIKGGGWLEGLKNPTSKHIIISNIIITDTYSYALKLQQGIDTLVNNFYIENCERGIEAYSDLDGLSLINGIIKNSREVGMNIESSNASLSNIEIYNSVGSGFRLGSTAKNTLLNNVRVFKSGSYNKIYASNFVMSNCIFSYGSDMGLSIESASNFKIIGCIFEGNTGDAIDTTGASGCNNYAITDCTFKNNAQGIDCNTNDDRIIITLNHFIGDTLDDHYISKGYVANNIGDDI